MEKSESKAKNSKKIKMAAAAVIVVGVAGAALYSSGATKGLFRPAANNGAQNSGTPVAGGIKTPERTPEIMGLVESVTGNEVKILMLDAASMPSASRPVGSANADAGGNRTGGGPSRGQYGDRQGQTGGGNAGAARAAMIAELKKKSIGEATVTVPVGIQMIKRGSRIDDGGAQGANNQPPQGANGAGAQGGGGVQASLSDLAADKLVMIWLNPKVTDKKAAEFVSIMR